MSKKEFGYTILLIIIAIFLLYLVDKDLDSQVKVSDIKSNLNTYVTEQQVNDLWVLARVINKEVTGCGIYDKIAVASSILNRVDDAAYDDTIYKVVYKKHQYAISDTFTKEDLNAAYVVYILGIRDCEIKYFFNPKKANKEQMRKIRSKNKLKLKTDCHEYY